MSQEKRTVAILQHHGDVGPGHFEDWLREHRIEYRLLRLDQGEPAPAEAAQFAGICSLGGPMSVNDALVTVEETVVMGGAGSACAELLAELGIEVPLLLLGLPDRFVDHGDTQQLLASVGLDAAGIERSIRERFAEVLVPARRVKSVA